MSALSLKYKLFKLICLVVIAAASVQTQAQTPNRPNKLQLPMVCSSLSAGYSTMEEYKEVPVFVGTDEQQQVENLMVVVFLNKATKTFTVSILNKEADLFCMLLSGINVYNNNTPLK